MTQLYDNDMETPDPFSSSLFFDMGPYDDTILKKENVMVLDEQPDVPISTFDDISDMMQSQSIQTPKMNTVSLIREIIHLPRIIFYETKKSHVLQIQL
jgi:hypothetical protein